MQSFRDAIPSFAATLSGGLHGSRSPICQCRFSARPFWVLPTQHCQHGCQSLSKEFGSCKWLGSRPCRMLASAKRILQFQNSQNTSALSNEAGVQFERRWNTTSISTQGSDPRLLQNLQIFVKWPNQDKFNSTSELSWQIRRASTPTWVGL